MTETQLKNLINMLEELGWTCAFPAADPDDDDAPVDGLIIGTQEYVESVTASLEKTGWEQ